MKIAGLVLVFAGVIALMKNAGFIISWNLIWPIALIFVGFAVKGMHCGNMCLMGRFGKGMCGSSKEMECEGGTCEEEGECADCKK